MEEKMDMQQPPELPKKRHSFRAGFVTGAFAMLLVTALVVGTAMYVTRYNGFSFLRRLESVRPSGNTAADDTAKTESEAEEPSSANSSQILGEMESKLSEIDRLVNENYIFDIDQEKLLNGALHGYVNGLNDIYSQYYTPEEYQDTLSDSDGAYVGIGVAVQQDPKTNAVTVLTVYADSPAEAGGMVKGDILVRVDDEDITSWTLSDIVDRIRGVEGTQVVVTVYREGEYVDITMTRAALSKMTVETRMLEDGIGYLQLTEFDNVSVEQIENGIKTLQEQGMERLVLDLRDNPGGLLTSVVAIADDFLPKADVLYIEDKKGSRVTYDSKDGEIWAGPMVVLINGNSASASEVLSGALKDNNRAILIGEQSFGKGIVQTFFPLSDGSGVKLTTAHYFTPSGTDIHGVGITPDLEVTDDTQTEEDEQLEAAVEEVKRLAE